MYIRNTCDTMKDNTWNRLFHRKALEEYKKAEELKKQIVGYFPILLQDLSEAKTLKDLLCVHKKAWSLGYQNKNLGPCPWGMFRTKSIPDMRLEEVFLGGIWGLNTKPILFWEQYKDETMAGNGFGIRDDVKIYDIVMQQYRDLLRSNFREIKNSAQ